MNDLTDEVLSAYLDGELSGSEMAAVTTALAAQPDAQARLEHLKAADAALRAAMPAQAPDSADPLVQHIQTKAPKRGLSFGGRSQMGGALAAGLVGVAFGLAAAPALSPPPAGAFAVSHTLSRALSQQASGPAQDAIAIVFTFRSKSGVLCRQFTVSEGDGVACRQTKEWKVVAWEANPHAGEAHFDSAGAREAIDLYVDRIDACGPLPADEESALLKGN